MAAANAAARARALAAAEAGRDGVMTKDWVSLCLSRAVEGEEATVLSELGCPMAPMDARRTIAPGTRSRMPAGSAGRFRRRSG